MPTQTPTAPVADDKAAVAPVVPITDKADKAAAKPARTPRKRAAKKVTPPAGISFVAVRDELSVALATVRRAVGSGGTIPALACVRLVVAGDVLSLTCTDLDVSIATSIKVEDGADGATLVSARTLADTVRVSPAENVWLALAPDDQVIVRSGKFIAKMGRLDAANFPPTDAPAVDAVTVPSSDLLAGIQRVAYAASTDDGVPLICAVSFQGQRMVATDKFRLATQEVDFSLPGDPLVPARALVMVGALCSAALSGGVETTDVQADANHAAFTFGDTTLTSRTIIGSFPDWQQLVPGSGEPFGTVTLKREALIEALKRMRSVTDKAMLPKVTIAVLPSGQVHFSAVDEAERADDTIDGAVVGGEEKVQTTSFNPLFLLGALQSNTTALEVTLGLRGTKVCPLTAAGEPKWLCLLMPVRV